MGSIIKEYGKIIVVVLLLAGLLSFLIGSKKAGLLDMLSAAEPKAEVKNQNNVDLLVEESKRLPPVLVIKTGKLTVGIRYQFSQFVTEAHDMEGTQLEVVIMKIIGPGGMVIDADPIVAIKGTYKVTYRIVDAHGLQTKKTVCFVAD